MVVSRYIGVVDCALCNEHLHDDTYSTLIGTFPHAVVEDIQNNGDQFCPQFSDTLRFDGIGTL
jgi:hypothetical protein